MGWPDVEITLEAQGRERRAGPPGGGTSAAARLLAAGEAACDREALP